jgi:ATP-dependent RNA helicase DDX19/DBP5
MSALVSSVSDANPSAGAAALAVASSDSAAGTGAPAINPDSASTAADTKEAVDQVGDQFKQMAMEEKSRENRIRNLQAKGGTHLADASVTTFEDPRLQLPRHLIDALTRKMKFLRPSKVQAACLPLVIRRENIIAQAQSGSGKTITFCSGLLNVVDPAVRAVQGLCLAPTRELASQIVRAALRPMSAFSPGVVIEEALAGMRVQRGTRTTANIVVGTPGKVLDLMKQGYFNFSQLRIFVLDEADAMVANSTEARSLAKQTLDIMKEIPSTCQILFFSATFEEEVLAFSRSIVPRAYEVSLKNTESLVLKEIKQVTIDTSRVPGGKLKLLQDIYSMLTIQQSIVFCEEKKEADEVSRAMNEKGFTVSTLHGDLENEERDVVMAAFRGRKSNVLVTTNALARGIDVPSVAVVVNYDLPVKRQKGAKVPDYPTYVHRIGRTGRFGAHGTAINFINNAEDARLMAQIEEYYQPSGGMLHAWDPTDVEGLAADHNERSQGYVEEEEDSEPVVAVASSGPV